MIKVIGIGSPFGYDPFGWQVIDALEAEGLNLRHEPVELIKTDRPGVGLLSLLNGASKVLLIDAIDDAQHSGQLRQLDKDELLETTAPLSSHAIGVAEALRLGEALGDLPPWLRLYGLCIDITTDLQHATAMQHAAVSELAQTIIEDIASLIPAIAR